MNARTYTPFDSCLKAALVLADDWIPRWLDLLQAALVHREATGATHEKRGFSHARSVLTGCRDRLAARLVEAFSEAVHADMGRDTGSPTVAPRKPMAALSLDDLTLMDHGQVQASVELARLQQVVKMAVDDELITLSALLSAARGLRNVRAEANPLRPEVVIDALMATLTELRVDEAARLRWLHAGAVSLGQELSRFYAALVRHLEADGVQPAGYVVVPTVLPVRMARAPSADPGGEPGSEPAAGDAPLVLTLDHLHRLLVGNLAQGGAGVSDHGASGSGNALVRTLAAEVVTLMLRTIAEDRRLLAPVRDLVMQLKPALLHLAKTDPRFFADRDNPARRLLDAITARSLAYIHEQDTGFGEFAGQVLHAVQSLQTPSADLPERVVACMQQMESLGLTDQGPAMQTLVRVEQRHLLAERVAREIRARDDFARAPALVKRFLCGPWAQAVAHARLSADILGELAAQPDLLEARNAPSERYMDMLTDLLWSCQLSQASQNRARLVRVVPVVLRTLREGLDAIDFPRERAESFFQALMGLHEAAYKSHRSDDLLAATERRQEDAAEPWLQGFEARESGFIDTQLMVTEFADTEPVTCQQSLSSGETLAVGAWIELQYPDRVQRCQLRWASPHRTLFLFATAEGQSVSLTRQGMDRLEAGGQLRVVAEHGVVDEALAAVARLAWVNSGKLA
jgi:hypothetical protein